MGNNLHYLVCAKADEGALKDFQQMDEAKTSKLTLGEILALRFYTSTSFGLINDPLRNLSGQRHPLALTTYNITSGLKKLLALNFKDKDTGQVTYLWRGIGDRTVNDAIMINGGSEPACMSTSENVRVVAGDAQSQDPLLLRIKVESPMDKGASLDWLSVYPSEKEVLYPPLTRIETIYKQSIMNSTGICITVNVKFPSYFHDKRCSLTGPLDC